MAEAIVLEIEIADFTKKLQEGIGKLDELKKEYANAVAKGNEFTEESLRAKAAVDAQQKSNRMLQGSLNTLAQATNDLSKNVQANIAAGQAQNNTINQNRKAYNALYALYRDNPTPQLAKDLQHLNKVLKEQEGAVGDTRRNVGNYTESIKDAFKQLKIGSVEITQVTGALSAAKDGFVAAGGGVKGFSAALATTGIPLIVMGIQSLIDVLSSFEPIAEAVEDTINGFGAAFTALTTGGSIDEAIRLTQEYTDTLRDLEDTQASFNLEQQAYLNQIDELLIKAKDRTKSDEERIASLKKASNIEKLALKETLERLDEEFTKTFDKVKGIGKIREDELNDYLYGTQEQVKYYQNLFEKNRAIDKKDLKRLQELALEKAKVYGQSNALQERISNRQRQLEDDIAKEKQDNEKKKQQAIDETTRKEEEAKQKQEQYNNQLNALEDEFILSERERLAKSFDEKLNQIKGNSQREILLTLAIKAEKQLALDKFDADAEAKIQEKRNNRYIQDYSDRQKALDELSKNHQMQLELEKIFNLNQQQIDDEYQSWLKTRKRDELATFEEFYRQKKSLYEKDQQEAKKSTAIISNEVSQTIQNVTQIISGVVNLISAIGDNLAQQSEQNIASLEAQKEAGLITEKEFAARAKEEKIKAFKEAKALNIVMAVMNTANAVMAQLSNPTPYVGIVLAALAAATGAAQIALIAKQQPPKFAKGGYTGSGYGRPDSSGYKPAGIVHEGEYVIPKWQVESPRYSGMINALESGRLRKYADGGYVARQSSEQVTSNMAMQQIMTNAMKQLPTPVVKVTELEKVQTNRQKSINISEL